MNELKISLAPRTLDAAKCTKFRSETIEISELEETLKSNNYSLINWKTDKKTNNKIYDRYRDGAKFESASGLVIDIDTGLSIDDAEKSLQGLGVNYIIITSKNHQKIKKNLPPEDRFHILIPFNKPTSSSSKYKTAFTYFHVMFPDMDTQVMDLGRYIFYSPDDALCRMFLDADFFNIDDVKTGFNLKEASESMHEKYWEFDLEQKITLANGRTISVSEVTKKVPCHCALPDHEDNTPSAFVQYHEESDRYMIYCSSCDALGWSNKTTFETKIKDKVDDFYFHGKDIIELGLSESKFFATRTARDAYYVLVGADDSAKQELAFRYIVENKRLANIARVDYIGDVNVDYDRYNVDIDTGVITISVSAIPVKVQDNDFIEKYLIKTFGAYHDFIKQYLAMYVYTNYQQLPTMILHGPRGTSKTTFAEMVGAIFPNLYIDWRGNVGNFTPEAEKKLAIIEENELNEKSQYKILKKYSGQKYLTVNVKYQPEYLVRNNLNIILLSNEPIPIFVEKTELPTDVSNNQFFVYKFPELKGKRDGNFSKKLSDRLGHYVRTELKTVFDGINKDYSRYGIDVPITSFEKELFDSNVTNIEANATLVMDKIYNYCKGGSGFFSSADDPHKPDANEIELFRNGYLAFSLIQKFASHGIHPNAMVKNLKKRNVIEDAGRKTINKQKYSCYKIIDCEYYT